ncbi:hypothetical protein GSI_11394 [Ganoderma sinense ZZ0214-1]|uniref:Uncharacterized protein n=1 Tax=Ganoderma sinense ZZ0214-1 TaxID=1077348 RepID=A0A2G8RVV2_9APHY|nr:hypothetical protein GSI_11394 [Ganoderma sinense ZZ0214-1]
MSEMNPGEQDLPSGETEASDFDPVGILLDYMLAKTEAEYAVAKYTDVLAIFGTTGFPDDIVAGLEAIQPPIKVDEDGVATVVVDATSRFDDHRHEQTSAKSSDIGSTQAAQKATVRGQADLPSAGSDPGEHAEDTLPRE